MSDEELDEVVKDIKKDFCQSGYRMVLGVLRSRGYRIQQRRVMESLRRVDVEGVIMRSLQLKIIHRREYRVYGPNALWHIDTNHKLIRHLSEFSQGWNNHGLSTERSKIPIQLWISGMFDMANSNHRAAREVWEPRTDAVKFSERASIQSNRKWHQLKCAEEILLRSRTVGPKLSLERLTCYQAKGNLSPSRSNFAMGPKSFSRFMVSNSY
ncbi:uncharacterized protein [Acropora muricata]|uniref:uncharacterized protein isoform X2 n=1 Tax=Acropora muricata TaxID=159855 RepID=UPI0034E3A03D